MKILRLSWPLLRRHWPGIIVAVSAIVAQTVLTLLAPWPLKFIFDSVIAKHPLPAPLGTWLATLTAGRSATSIGLLSALIIVTLLLALAKACVTYLGSRMTATIGQRTVTALRQQVFARLQMQSLAFFRRNRIGDLTARLTGDIQAIQDLITSGVNSLLTNLLNVVGVVIIVSFIDWHFTLIMLCAAPLLLFVSNSYRGRIQQASRQIRNVEGQISSLAQEKLSAMLIVQGYTRETTEQAQFTARTTQSLDASLTQARLQAEMPTLVDLVGAITLGAITWLAVREVIFGHITPGFVLLFTAYFRSILRPVRQLAKLSGQLSKANAATERLQEVLLVTPEIQDLPAARPAPPLRGFIAFEHVTFGYHPNAPVLRDISFTVKKGEMVALVGPTGSGKSSLLNLIPRFADPQHGQIMLDSIDLRDMTLHSLRQQISLVFQEPVLFSGTIRDNIAYGRPDATDEDILRAAKATNIHEQILRLPQGYATIVGERGATLSGGQRQLVSIARAMVRDSPILLLDEPTTGLDAESEHMVVSALEHLIAGRTTIMIAHRLYTVEHANHILVLSNGHIRESGTHHELLGQRGLYARWRSLQGADDLAVKTS